MINFETCIKEEKVKQVPRDYLRAKSVIKSSEQAITTARLIPLIENSAKTIFRELYESLREYCEAVGYLKGYKFLDHLSITCFLKDILKEDIISSKFDRYRKLRIGINYYGDNVNIETVKAALIEIPKLINQLKRHAKIK